VSKIKLAPQVGLEPTTLRLTAECSAIELLRSDWQQLVYKDNIKPSGWSQNLWRAGMRKVVKIYELIRDEGRWLPWGGSGGWLGGCGLT